MHFTVKLVEIEKGKDEEDSEKEEGKGQEPETEEESAGIENEIEKDELWWKILWCSYDIIWQNINCNLIKRLFEFLLKDMLLSQWLHSFSLVRLYLYRHSALGKIAATDATIWIVVHFYLGDIHLVITQRGGGIKMSNKA